MSLRLTLNLEMILVHVLNPSYLYHDDYHILRLEVILTLNSCLTVVRDCCLLNNHNGICNKSIQILVQSLLLIPEMSLLHDEILDYRLNVPISIAMWSLNLQMVLIQRYLESEDIQVLSLNLTSARGYMKSITTEKILVRSRD